VAAPYFAMIDTVMGREYGERKVVKVRCRSGTQRAYFFQNISPCSYRVPYPALSG
jgi:DNA primase